MLRSQLVRGEQHDDGGDEGEQDASATLGRVAAVRVARLHAARVVEALELEVTAVADAHDFWKESALANSSTAILSWILRAYLLRNCTIGFWM